MSTYVTEPKCHEVIITLSMFDTFCYFLFCCVFFKYWLQLTKLNIQLTNGLLLTFWKYYSNSLSKFSLFLV